MLHGNGYAVSAIPVVTPLIKKKEDITPDMFICNIYFNKFNVTSY